MKLFLKSANQNKRHPIWDHDGFRVIEKYPKMFEELAPYLMKKRPAAYLCSEALRNLENFLWFINFDMKIKEQEAKQKRYEIYKKNTCNEEEDNL